jgi:predicted DNA-binding WGR domain protein
MFLFEFWVPKLPSEIFWYGEVVNDKSSKFYKIEIVDEANLHAVYTIFGRIGSKGQRHWENNFNSLQNAINFVHSLKREKTRKGYVTKKTAGPVG